MAPKKTSKASPKKTSKASAKLVKMQRGDQKADVHPSEVENWEKANWVKAS